MTLHVHTVLVTTAGRPLADVTDVRLERGRPLTIVGESGSGKSLFAQALMGTLAPELDVVGRVTLDGAEHDLSDRRARRRLWGRTLALLPQEPVLALDPTMRVGAQVAEGAATWRADRSGARTSAATLLTGLGLGGELGAYPHTLSGGMAQRVAFAAATIGGAQVLIADEPSKGLDEQARADLAALLLRHVETGGILLTITHDLDLARTLGGDALVMRAANVLERGPVEQVLTQPQHEYTRRLLAAEPARWTHPWAVSGNARAAGQPLAVGRGLTKRFGDKTLFTGLDITIDARERLALSGPSGSGKTTLGNILLRLAAPDAGSVEHALELSGGRLQKLYQDPTQAFPARVPLGVGVGDVLRRHRRDPGRLLELLHTLRLDPTLLERRPGQISGGELQRIAIIRAALLEPALLFADEPTSRLDLITQEETIDCLMQQLQATDCALVLVTHDRPLADAVSQRHVALAPAGARLQQAA
jgi:peptide/nickel transport system ATP-binding protein